MKYLKINTIWKREDKKGKIIEGKYSKDEIPNIKMWHITEKIHGTNIRVEFDADIVDGVIDIQDLKFFGKTDNAEIPDTLLEYLKATFKPLRLTKMLRFKPNATERQEITLYGEGYGPKIQKGGGRYRDDASFILFDVKINEWWLEPPNVKDIASSLEIEYVPELGVMDEESAVSLVKTENHFISKIAKDKTYVAEGIVARSYPMVLFRDGAPAMWKLKVADFKDRS